ncbi:FMRFamide-activated amiloride-sensitive sodium channel-like [Rhopilema esculentum]|uniref:FMRFamide-activated amiloride-sensitive sodium channel-like n=1 Tax=Rhopilema esculentum TaxID=499914 RepID=UPI0031D9EEC9
MEKHTKKSERESSTREKVIDSEANLRSQQKESYLTKSTIHGLSKIEESKHWSLKLLWSLAILALFVGSVTNIVFLVAEFLEFQTYVLVEEHTNDTAKFPSVTICNLNCYQKSKFNSLVTDMERRFQSFLNKSMERKKVLSMLKHPGFFNFMIHSNITLTKATQFASDKLFLDGIEDWCRFGSFQDCNRSDFTDSFLSHHSGFCKTFNVNGNGKFTQTLSGVYGGLNLVLYVNQDDYMELVPYDNAAGVLVMVHPQDVFPCPNNDRFVVQPGTQTLISIEQKFIFRKEKPYTSKCVNREGDPVYPGRYGVNNCLQSNCLQSCHHLKLYERCGIIANSALYHLSRRGKKLPNPPKNVSGDAGTCLLEFYGDLSSKKGTCDCPLPCYEETFKLTGTSSRWPTNVDMQYYRPVLSKVLNRTNVSEDFIRSNFLQLNVYFKSFSYQKAMEAPAMNFFSLVAGIGGSLGLFIGASFFSILEFLTFIITSLFGRYHRRIGHQGAWLRDKGLTAEQFTGTRRSRAIGMVENFK